MAAVSISIMSQQQVTMGFTVEIFKASTMVWTMATEFNIVIISPLFLTWQGLRCQATLVYTSIQHKVCVKVNLSKDLTKIFLIKIRDKKKTQPTRYINLSNAYFSYQILNDYICDFLLIGLTPWLPQPLNLINHK